MNQKTGIKSSNYYTHFSTVIAQVNQDIFCRDKTGASFFLRYLK
jgi:hypothetical protein